MFILKYLQALAELQLDGQSNFGFQPDDWNCDTVSRYTATTEIADEKESGSKTADIKDDSGNGGAKTKVKQDKPKRKKVEKEGDKTEETKVEEDCMQKSGIEDVGEFINSRFSILSCM